MNRETRTSFRFLAAAVGLGTVFTGTTAAQAQIVPVKQVGQWAIETDTINGKFNFCRARAKGQGGDITIVQWPNGNWTLNIPPLPFPAGSKQSGMMELRRASIPFNVTIPASGFRPGINLNAELLDGLRGGGNIQLSVGGKTFSLQMDDAATAIGAVSDCRNMRMASGGTPAPQAPNPAAPAGPDVTKTVKTVGPWTIQSVHSGGVFNRCRGAMKVVNDEIGFVKWANGGWGVTFPNKGWTTGTMLNGSMSLNGAVTPITNLKATTGLRPSLTLNDAKVQTFRGGGDMVVQINGQTFNWHVGVAGEMFGAIEDCWRANT